MPRNSENPGAFPPTRWTLIARASATDSALRDKALTEICKLYWQPIYAFLCARGHNPHDAEDFTQGFLAQFLAEDHFSTLIPEKGRLRSYLLAALKRHLANEFRRKNRQKRGGGAQIISIDAAGRESAIALMRDISESDPDRVFDRIWAIKILDTAYAALERRYRESGRGTLFEKLSPLVRTDRGTFDHACVAADLGLSPMTLRVAAHRFRERYGIYIREVVMETVSEDEDPAEEIRYLMSVFS